MKEKAIPSLRKKESLEWVWGGILFYSVTVLMIYLLAGQGS